jgi:membrane fusion protein (multidrug efflux system)
MDERTTYRAVKPRARVPAIGGSGREGAWRVGLAGGIALAAAGALGWALTRRAPEPELPAAGSPVLELLPQDVGVAEQRVLRRRIPLTGALQAREQTEVKSQLAGEIAEVTVRSGETVHRSQLLARLDARDARAKLEEKLANLAAGKAQLVLAERRRASAKVLLAQNLISRFEYDSRESEYRVGVANVRSLDAQLEQARKVLADTAVLAPLDGVIAERAAQPGSAVTPSTKLFTILDLSTLELAALVPAKDIPVIQIGQQATFQIEGFDERAFAGTIERINPATEPGSRSIAVYVRIANPERQLRAGMFAQGAFVVDEKGSVTLIPAAALREESGLPFVYRIASGTLIEQPVEVAARDPIAGVVQVTSGIEAGAAVVVGNLENLRAGLSVHVAPAAPPPAR